VNYNPIEAPRKDRYILLLHCIHGILSPEEEEMNKNDNQLVTVFVTGDEGVRAVASSILEGAGIPYFEKGGASHNLGLQVFNLSAGSVEFQVHSKDATAARELLSHLE
jgi:hypothetical protein